MKFLITLVLMLPFLGFTAEQKILTLSESTTISFSSQFSGPYVAKKQMEAIQKCSQNLGKTLIITLYTPGGSVSAGKLFFDTLKALPCKFDTLTIFAASMGYQTVQNLGKRYILPSGILMSHRAHVSGLSGEIGGELDSIISLLNRNITALDNIAANRVGITLDEYRNLVSDELWMTGSQSVEMNHADEVVLAKCDESLTGTHYTKMRTLFGTFEVEKSDCPIVTGIISVRSSNEKEVNQAIEYNSNIVKYVTSRL